MAHGSFSEMNHTLGHKANLCKKIAITLCILPDYDAMKVKTDTKKKTYKHANSWISNNSFQNDECVKEEIKKEVEIFLELNENENTRQQKLWDTLQPVLWGKIIALGACIKKKNQKTHK